MDMQQQVREAIVEEIKRQAEAGSCVIVGEEGEERLQVEGRVNLDELAMAVVGAVAGGP